MHFCAVLCFLLSPSALVTPLIRYHHHHYALKVDRRDGTVLTGKLLTRGSYYSLRNNHFCDLQTDIHSTCHLPTCNEENICWPFFCDQKRQWSRSIIEIICPHKNHFSRFFAKRRNGRLSVGGEKMLASECQRLNGLFRPRLPSQWLLLSPSSSLYPQFLISLIP